VLVHTGSYSAAPSIPTTAALTPLIMACAPARFRKASQNGSAPSRTRIPGRKMPARPSAAPASPCGSGDTTVPRYAANVKSGPGTAWAAP
jgi:hypothetical protein